MSNRAMDNLLDEATDLLSIHLGVLETHGDLDVCESPIERAFLAAYDMHHLLSRARAHIGLPTSEMAERCAASRHYETFMVPQWKVAGYRADFLLGYAGAGTDKQTSIIIECDGHEWHERTKEQAQRDKERDRVLQSHVAKVIRFTGSEVHAHPLQCFQEALSVLDASLFAWVSK